MDEESPFSKVINAEYSKLEIFLLWMFVFLIALLLIFTYAAQKDVNSVRKLLYECNMKIANINEGQLPLFTPLNLTKVTDETNK
jgi:hypothetical protein